MLSRLIVLPFNRVIPPEEMIPGIGRRIGAEETDALLAFAVEGASEVIANGGAYDIPASCEKALDEWAASDSVTAWLAAKTVEMKGDDAKRQMLHGKPWYADRAHEVPTWGILHRDYENYAAKEGHDADKIPGVSTFTQRVQEIRPAVVTKTVHGVRYAAGLALKTSEESNPKTERASIED